MDNKQAFNELVGSRVRIAREKANMNQSVMAEKLGVASHQIVSQIETGARAVSTDELFILAELFGQPVDFFTDPYLIVADQVLSFRAERSVADLEGFEKRVSNLVSAAVRFSDLVGEMVSPFERQLHISRDTSVIKAAGLGAQVAQSLDLGPIPAAQLQDCIEKKLGIVVMKVDAPHGISGAACHMPEIDLILINRNEAACRQNFDLAHELFHVLTWSRLPPERHDWINGSKTKVEKLADAFASGLLMPFPSMKARWDSRDTEVDLHEWIVCNAVEMRVSGLAFYWRLVACGFLSKSKQAEIDRSRLSRPDDASQKPLLFCESFVRHMHQVLEQGKVSARKAASLVGLEVDEFDSLFASYGLESPF